MFELIGVIKKKKWHLCNISKIAKKKLKNNYKHSVTFQSHNYKHTSGLI